MKVPDDQSQTASLDESEAAIGRRWARSMPTSFGRYRVEEKLGAGGMGVVYGAYDDELRRRVAIKVSYRRTPDDRTRFIAEARAMAALVHPNIVTAYDFGVHADTHYLVLERVTARTLSEYIRLNPPVQTRRRLLHEAAMGLDAAHTGGVVHRDVKPQNVLVDRSDRARITDFGLAAFVSSAASPEADTTAPPNAEGTPIVAGTPGYMSPEQHLGEEPSTRSDQYSLCVMVLEVMTGVRPFRATHGETVLGLKLRGIAPQQLELLPRSLRRPVARGLDPNPAKRHADLRPLLTALLGRRVSRVFPVVGGLGVVVASALAWVAAPAARDVACEPTTAPQWDDAATRKLAEAFSGIASAHADETLARTQGSLVSYVRRWHLAFEQSCRLETQTRGPATQCLVANAKRFDTLREQLFATDADLTYSVSQVARLPPPHRCIDDPEASQASDRDGVLIDEVQRALAASKAALGAGQPQTARDQLRAGVRLTEAIETETERARLRAELGDGLDAAGDPEGARSVLLAAVSDASSSPATEATASIMLGWVTGVSLGDTAAGERWLRRAALIIEANPVPALLEARRLSHLASVLSTRDDFDGMIATLRRALAVDLGEGDGVDRHARLVMQAQLSHNLGVALLLTQEYGEAQDSFANSVELSEQAFGPAHPELTNSLGGLSEAAVERGELDVAEHAAHRRLEILQGARGADHPSLARALKAIASVEHARGDLVASANTLERAIELLEPTDLFRLYFEVDAARLLEEQGKLQEARMRATEVLQRVDALTDPQLRGARAAVLRTLAEIHRKRGAHELALAAIERAKEQAEGTRFGSDNAELLEETEARVRRDHAAWIRSGASASNK